MTLLLLDTCTLAELRQPKPNKSVQKLIASMPENVLFISAISMGEISKGIHLLPSSKRKTELQQWVEVLEHHYQDRILKVDLNIAGIWGEITARAQQKGKIISTADGLIAATAIAHGLHVATRNVKDFELTGVLLINPWDN